MTTTPNHAPSPTEVTPASDEVRGLYSIDAVNEWRSNESLRLGWLRAESIESEAYDDHYVTTFKDTIDEKLDDFLAAKGVTPGDASYDTLRQLYRDTSIDRFSENEWGNSPASRGIDEHDTQSQSEKTKEVIRQWHDAQTESTEADHDSDTERTIDTVRTELNEARELWSAMQARRQGRLWDRRIPGYNAARERYENLQRELGSRTLEDTINNDTLSDVEKNAAVIAYIFEEQNTLRASTKEKVKNTRVSKFVDKFGGWLNKGSGWAKFGKAAAVGLGAGIVGVGAGLLFGAAGMGAMVAGAGVMATKGALRFTKAYAKSDARQGRGMNEMEDDAKDEWTHDLADQDGDNIIDKVLNLSKRKFEADTKKEQNKRQKTTAIAFGGLALGAGVATGVGFALDGLGVSGDVHGSIVDRHPPIDHEGGDVDPEVPGSLTEEEVNQKIEDAEDRLREDYEKQIDELEEKIDELSQKDPEVPETPDDNGDYDTDWTDYIGDHADALVVESGEGWFQTFNELGISAEDHKALLTEVGPKLVEMNVAYYDSSIGGYGILRPGAMPEEALRYILEVAYQQGIEASSIGLPKAGV